MCLTLNEEATKRLRNKYPPGTILSVWKTIISEPERLRSEHQSHYNWYKSGTIKSDRQNSGITEEERKNGKVCKGIHAWLERPPMRYDNRYRALELKANIDDLVNFDGLNHAVFSHVELTPEALADACVAVPFTEPRDHPSDHY